ncbi:MAG: myxosortase MrtP [Myxococcota bacterium]
MSSSDDDKPAERSGDTEAPEESETEIGLEVGGIFLLALALILVLTFAAGAVPFIAQNLYALVAAVFVGLPYVLLTQRDMDFDRFGLTWDDWQTGARWGLIFSVATLVPFAVGYWVWATQIQDQSMQLSVENYYQWDYELDGRPVGWGDEPGAWFWTDDQRAHIGIRSGKEPVTIRMSGDRPFDIASVGAVKSSRSMDEKRKVWTLTVREAQTRGQVIIGRDVDDALPRRMTIEMTSPEEAQLYAGPAAAASGDSLKVGRKLTWILLWIATQLMFIALPEEFFYRGYIQTRIADFLKRRRKRRGKDAELPSFLGFKMPNLVASVLFSAGHLFVPVGGAILANRASVFFPSLLFGWLRDRNGTISGAVVYHAASNLMVLMTAPHFF